MTCRSNRSKATSAAGALSDLAKKAEEHLEFKTGEVTSPGTLTCQECQAELHMKTVGRIPPCPKCHKTVFRKSYWKRNRRSGNIRDKSTMQIQNWATIGRVKSRSPTGRSSMAWRTGVGVGTGDEETPPCT